MTKNFSIIPDCSKITLLSLPKRVENIYWLDGVIHEGEPPINQLKEGQVLSFQTPRGKDGQPNFRVMVSKVFADGDYFGKRAIAYEDVYESSDPDAKLLRTTKQDVGSYYGGTRYKKKSIIKDGEELYSIIREENFLGKTLYKDMKGNKTVEERTFLGFPRNTQIERNFHFEKTIKGKLQRLILRCSTFKDTGCEIPYIRKLGGLLFKLIK